LKFDTFNLDTRLLSNIHAAGYTTATPIQQKSIPVALSGTDVLGLAQTGTGKTAAFLLPLLQRLIEGERGKIRAVIISPTRELAQQTHDAIGQLAKHLNIHSVTLYGGVAINPQIQRLRRGVDIAVACPGRLLDHIQQGTIDLSKVEVLVLDEADHMFDVGFLPVVRKILQKLPTKRQSLLFSATMPSEVRELAHQVLKKPTTIQIDHTAPVKTVTQALYPVSQNLKSELLIALLQTHNISSALVFTRTKHRAKRLAEQLKHAGYTSTSLQGNLTQRQRQTALDGFRNGKLQILVATDIAARGIDIALISHVINYDMPDTVEAYTHRIGRTGRAAKLGDAFTLITREDANKLRALERTLGAKIEQRTLPDFNYKASGPVHEEVPRKMTHKLKAPRKKPATKPYGERRIARDTQEKIGSRGQAAGRRGGDAGRRGDARHHGGETQYRDGGARRSRSEYGIDRDVQERFGSRGQTAGRRDGNAGYRGNDARRSRSEYGSDVQERFGSRRQTAGQRGNNAHRDDGPSARTRTSTYRGNDARRPRSEYGIDRDVQERFGSRGQAAGRRGGGTGGRDGGAGRRSGGDTRQRTDSYNSSKRDGRAQDPRGFKKPTTKRSFNSDRPAYAADSRSHGDGYAPPKRPAHKRGNSKLVAHKTTDKSKKFQPRNNYR
jgi:ATP-dependent RNA helicase RhlE